MPVLHIRLEVPDDVLAADTADKLMGNKGPIAHSIASYMANAIMESGKVKVEFNRNNHTATTSIVASLVVGEEVIRRTEIVGDVAWR